MENDLEPVKLVFLGDSSVGKTSFLLNFTNGQLIEADSSVVCDFSDNIELDGTRYHVNFWDINGDLEDRLRPLVYPGTSVFMLCFDISNRTSFENIKDSWTTEIRQYMPDTPSLLIGNKMDLRDQSKSNGSGTVTEEEAWELAKSLGTSYVENSATTGENVKDVVHTALRVVADQQKLQSAKCRCHRLFKWINKCKHRK